MLRLETPANELEPDLEVELLWPPSVNDYWQTGMIFPKTETMSRRVESIGWKDFHQWLRRSSRTMTFLSARAKKFRADCGWLLVKHRGAIGSSPCAVEVDLRPPTGRVYDVDNFNKGLFDALQHFGVFEDDKQIRELLIRKGAPQLGGTVFVRAWRIPGQ